MDAAAERELRELRARAYGRDADIAMDAAAAGRLQELESERSAPAGPADLRASQAPAPATTASAEQEPEDTDDLLAIEKSANDDATPQYADTETARRDERRIRRRATWWAASVVASAAVAAVVTFTLSSTVPVSASSGAPQIETLQLEPASDRIPQEWFGVQDDTIGADFLGFTVFTIPGWSGQDDSGSTGPNCIAVVETAQIPPVDDFDQYDWTYGGDFYSGCGIGVFPATVEVPIRGGAPDEMLGRYPAAEALQFVLDGDRVGVFLDEGSD
ncbi:hypothetical protein [Microbacterium sp. UFMG61]|uniref:hypothetical protein n=1 Tax=Microbacterium sp. UFMG61 TaxID=2745935 RepID=UPI00188F94D3|nr:hypothetical protein [Microbacterium sp. UFMG61]